MPIIGVDAKYQYVYIDSTSVENFYFSTKDGEYPYWRVRMKSGDVYWVHNQCFTELAKALGVIDVDE